MKQYSAKIVGQGKYFQTSSGNSAFKEEFGSTAGNDRNFIGSQIKNFQQCGGAI